MIGKPTNPCYVQYVTAGLRGAGLKHAVINIETKTNEIFDDSSNFTAYRKHMLVRAEGFEIV
jgi:hypothetical protein